MPMTKLMVCVLVATSPAMAMKSLMRQVHTSTPSDPCWGTRECPAQCGHCRKNCDPESGAAGEADCKNCLEESGCEECIKCHVDLGDFDLDEGVETPKDLLRVAGQDGHLQMPPSEKKSDEFPIARNWDALKALDEKQQHEELISVLNGHLGFDVTQRHPHIRDHTIDQLQQDIAAVLVIKQETAGNQDLAEAKTKDTTGCSSGVEGCVAGVSCGSHEWNHGGHCKNVRAASGDYGHETYWCATWINFHCWWFGIYTGGNFVCPCQDGVRDWVNGEWGYALQEEPSDEQENVTDVEGHADAGEENTLEESLSGKRSC